jgi:hypothetical protein
VWGFKYGGLRMAGDGGGSKEPPNLARLFLMVAGRMGALGCHQPVSEIASVGGVRKVMTADSGILKARPARTNSNWPARIHP